MARGPDGPRSRDPAAAPLLCRRGCGWSARKRPRRTTREGISGRARRDAPQKMPTVPRGTPHVRSSAAGGPSVDLPPARRLVLQSLQSLDRLPTRRGTPVYHRDGRMVGYAVLGPDAKPSRSSGTFRRRVFRLLPHDRDAVPDGLYTTGAPGGGGGPAHDRAPEQKAQGRAFRGRTATLGQHFRLIRGRPSPLHLPISRFFLGGSRVPSTGSDRLRSTPHCKQTAKWRGVRRKQRAWDPPSTVNSRALLELPEILLADLLSWDPRPYF